ncbi:MAG: ABC transporter ATP-binding protein [Halodesulfurarchaeum sp.]
MSESSSTVRGEDRHDHDPPDALVEVDGLTKHFDQDSGFLASIFGTEQVRAVEDVSFEIRRGETLGLVGESGCGKSTLARTILKLIEPTDGDVYFDGVNLADLSGEELRVQRKDAQMILQDPQSSLDPRIKVGKTIEEPMKAHGMYDADGRERRAKELLEAVGLDPQQYNRYPHQFSGGQRQRINLARALSVNPDFVVLDEPVSALDVSIQAQVLNTMEKLQEEFDLTYLFITHDLSVIRHISDRVAVMYLGEIIELGPTKEVFNDPRHPYTRSLLDAIPVPDPRAIESRTRLEGNVPSPIDPPSGCRFRTRCPSLIKPHRLDLTETEWEQIRRFTRAVKRHTFKASSKAEVRSTFFDGNLPGGEAGEVLEAAIDGVVDGQWEDSADALAEAFEDASICARERPVQAVDMTSDGQSVACHLHLD